MAESTREALNRQRKFAQDNLDEVEKKHQQELDMVIHNFQPENQDKARSNIEKKYAGTEAAWKEDVAKIDKELEALGPASEEEKMMEEVFLAKLASSKRGASQDPMDRFLDRQKQERGNLSMEEQIRKEQGKEREEMQRPHPGRAEASKQDPNEGPKQDHDEGPKQDADTSPRP